MFYLKTLTPLWLLLVISLPTGADETSSGARLYNPEHARNLVWSPQPNHKWVLGHPIGNGGIGGMVVGHPLRERIGLNHDRLWRQYYSFRKYDTASIMPEFRRLCAADRFSEAQVLLLSKCVKEATLKYGGI